MLTVSDWNKPSLTEWLEALENEISRLNGDFILVAHSLGCALAAHWVTRESDHRHKLKGILMVAPADVDDAACTPDSVRGFSPMPMMALNCKTVTVTSSNDPYVSGIRASSFAQIWGGTEINIGDWGHINGASGLGDWPAGKRILEDLMCEDVKGKANE